MKQTLSKFAARATAFLIAGVPAIVFAQYQAPLPEPPVRTPGQALGIICTIAGWLFAFLIVLAILFIIWAAFSYLTSGGNQEKVAAANKALIFAAVAIAVGLLARGVPLVVSGILGSNYAGTGC